MKPAELFRRDDDPVRLAPGQTLFREGETGDCMYDLLEGSADVLGRPGLEPGTNPENCFGAALILIPRCKCGNGDARILFAF